MNREEIVKNGCSGHCCESFTLPISPEDITALKQLAERNAGVVPETENKGDGVRKSRALSDIEKQILEGKICPYCKARSELIKAKDFYQKAELREELGDKQPLIYICHPCDAYVGCHKDSNKSLGRLARPALRKLKIKTHKIFDSIWREEKILTRDQAYAWLSKRLSLSPEYTHIGMFKYTTCLRVIKECELFLKSNKCLTNSKKN